MELLLTRKDLGKAYQQLGVFMQQAADQNLDHLQQEQADAVKRDDLAELKKKRDAELKDRMDKLKNVEQTTEEDWDKVVNKSND